MNRNSRSRICDSEGSVLQQIPESLAEAHQNGLVHRDIKPSNLYLSRMGVRADYVKVLDFGLVKSLTTFQSVRNKAYCRRSYYGTPAFMAPEMALGKSQVDAHSDIYALGCVAYWLLTESLVFPGETPMEIVVNHVKTEPIPPIKENRVTRSEGFGPSHNDLSGEGSGSAPTNSDRIFGSARTMRIDISLGSDAGKCLVEYSHSADSSQVDLALIRFKAKFVVFSKWNRKHSVS